MMLARSQSILLPVLGSSVLCDGAVPLTTDAPRTVIPVFPTLQLLRQDDEKIAVKCSLMA